MKIIELIVKPNSKKNNVEIIHGNLVVYLTKTPEKGKANKQLLTIIADYFKIKTSQIIILNGEKSQIKKIGILET